MRSTPPEPLEFGVATAMDPVSTTGWTHTRLDFALDAPLPFQNLGREGGICKVPWSDKEESQRLLVAQVVWHILRVKPTCGPRASSGSTPASTWDKIQKWGDCGARRRDGERRHSGAWVRRPRAQCTAAARARVAHSDAQPRPAAGGARACFQVRADVEQVSRKKIEKFGPIRCPTRRSRSGCLWHKWFGTSSV